MAHERGPSAGSGHMDLVPDPGVDEAMKAMQEVNELRAQLEASTAKLKQFTLPVEPAADFPPPPADIVADPVEAVKAVEAAERVTSPGPGPLSYIHKGAC